MAYDEDLAVRIRRSIRGRSDIAERKMFGGLAFLRNGRMCCGIVGCDLVVRVLAEEMEDALGRPHVRPMDFTGRPMRGFVYVSPAGCDTAATLRYWIDQGLRFVEDLKPLFFFLRARRAQRARRLKSPSLPVTAALLRNELPDRVDVAGGDALLLLRELLLVVEQITAGFGPLVLRHELVRQY